MDIPITENGDLYIEGTGVKKQDVVEYIAHRLRLIYKSKKGDWEKYPDKGANMTQYIGYPNIPSTKLIVEEELTDELDKDPIIGNFDIEVEYTPTSRNSALVETKVTLPDGRVVEIAEHLQLTGAVQGKETPVFTQPNYDTSTPIIRTEVVEIANASNVFPTKYKPINDMVFVIPFTDDLEFNDEGEISVDRYEVSQNTDMSFEYPFNDEIKSVCDNISGMTVVVDGDLLTEDEDYIVHPCSGLTISGVVQNQVKLDVQWYDTSGQSYYWIQQHTPTDEQLDDGEVYNTTSRLFTLSGEIQNVLENKLVDEITVYKDGLEIIPNDKEDNPNLDANEYDISTETITFGESPENRINIAVSYYDAEAITSVNVFEQEIVPGNAFPRAKMSDMYVVTTRNIFDPGPYIIQYDSYALEV